MHGHRLCTYKINFSDNIKVTEKDMDGLWQCTSTINLSDSIKVTEKEIDGLRLCTCTINISDSIIVTQKKWTDFDYVRQFELIFRKKRDSEICTIIHWYFSQHVVWVWF